MLLAVRCVLSACTRGTAVRLCLQPCPGQRLGSWQGAHSSAAQQAVLCHPSNLPGALGARSSHLGSPRASRHQPAFPLHVALSWKRSSVKTQLSPCCCLEERERCLYQQCSPAGPVCPITSLGQGLILPSGAEEHSEDNQDMKSKPRTFPSRLLSRTEGLPSTYLNLQHSRTL